MNILTFSSLFPNAVQTTHGIFVKTRLQRLIQSSAVEATVMAPVPWYPRSLSWPKSYSQYSQIAAVEKQGNLTVHHPRFLIVPKIGMSLTPFFMLRSGLRAVKALLAKGTKIDLIDAHYFYPDGVAAVMIGKALNIPVSVTARGTDINLIPKYRIPRALIVKAAARASVIFTVCAALREELERLGCDPEKIIVARNGVDLELFRPAEGRDKLRGSLGMKGLCILSVGHLISRKGHELCIEAIEQIPDATLFIIGDGPERSSLERLAQVKKVSHRVRFLGSLPQVKLQEYYAAADMLMLASSREGWANVLLESMACGTPVVATAIWGTPEVVAHPDAGELVHERSAAGLASAALRLSGRSISREGTRLYAENFSWAHTSALQLNAFRDVLARAQR